MQNSAEEVMDMLMSLALIGATALSFILSLFNSDLRMQDVLIKDVGNKATYVYSQAYASGDNVLSSAEVLTDILAIEEGVEIKVNDSTLNSSRVSKARAQNADAVRWIKTALSGEYEKVLYYGADGNIETVNYDSI